MLVLSPFGLTPERLERLIAQVGAPWQQQAARLWDYYENPATYSPSASTDPPSGRGYRLGQERGLPVRIVGGKGQNRDYQRKEVVVENDIGWRVDAGVDLLVGEMPRFVSLVGGARGREIERQIGAVLSASGGAACIRDLALLGSVYGFADAHLRPFRRSAAVEILDPARCFALLDDDDYTRIALHVQQYWQWLPDATGAPVKTEILELTGTDWWQRYANRQLVASGPLADGFLPVIHVQNLPRPFSYAGCGDVEPLLPLQDELNVRLTDRANRVTLQSFKMYLGKGIDGFADRPIQPSQMWETANPEAAVDEFGGDAACPSEAQHVQDVRDALDKTSGISPILGGLIRDRIGTLTSAVALRLTCLGTLNKNRRKQRTYGAGLAAICHGLLAILDHSGAFPNAPDEREVSVIFAEPFPQTIQERLELAALKRAAGVAQDTVLQELGYERSTPDA